MKTLRLLSISLFAVLLVFVACKADEMRDLSSTQKQTVNPVNSSGNNQPGQPTNPSYSHGSMTGRIASTSACGHYDIALESITQVGGNWEWVWSVTNPNPGNGNGGTTQNLSHWGMQFGSCFIFSSIVGAAYSADGVNWTSFTPVYQVDPSQSCMTTPVLKFDFGTVGNTPSYYKLVLNQNFDQGYVPGYYKSGQRTGCCIFNFNGVGCPGGPSEVGER